MGVKREVKKNKVSVKYFDTGFSLFTDTLTARRIHYYSDVPQTTVFIVAEKSLSKENFFKKYPEFKIPYVKAMLKYI